MAGTWGNDGAFPVWIADSNDDLNDGAFPLLGREPPVPDISAIDLFYTVALPDISDIGLFYTVALPDISDIGLSFFVKIATSSSIGLSWAPAHAGGESSAGLSMLVHVISARLNSLTYQDKIRLERTKRGHNRE